MHLVHSNHGCCASKRSEHCGECQVPAFLLAAWKIVPTRNAAVIVEHLQCLQLCRTSSACTDNIIVALRTRSSYSERWTVVASQWTSRRVWGNWEVAVVPIWGSEVPWRLAPRVLGGIGIKVLRGSWYARARTCVTRIDSLRTIVFVRLTGSARSGNDATKWLVLQASQGVKKTHYGVEPRRSDRSSRSLLDPT